MIKVLVADDHPVVRDGLRARFAEYPSIDLVGEAATGREAIKAAVIEKPDVIIMDLAMPDTDGFSATAEINRVAPEVAVLVLTMSDDDITMTKAMRGTTACPVFGSSTISDCVPIMSFPRRGRRPFRLQCTATRGLSWHRASASRAAA